MAKTCWTCDHKDVCKYLVHPLNKEVNCINWQAIRYAGKWILCEDSYFSKCSICGDIWLNEECWNYCSNCGAYMRSDNDGKK